MPNVTIIGAGSVEFTIDVLSNILSFDDLADVSVVLHDIDEARLETAGRIGARINEAKGGRATIETQLDRRKALDGADYAINEIQVGGRDAFLIDFAIPTRYGVRQTIADTLGIGGISRGLRTLPGDDRHRQRHGRRVPRRDAAELHEPDGDGPVGGLRRLAVRSRRRPVSLGASTRTSSWPRRSACRWTRSRSRRRASTTRRSSRGSSATARTSTRRSTPRSRPTPRDSAAASGSSSTRSSGTSRPSRASTPRSTCRGSCATTTRSSGSASRSTTTSDAPRRRWRTIARSCASWRRESPWPPSRGASSPPTSSTRSRPARRARSTRT